MNYRIIFFFSFRKVNFLCKLFLRGLFRSSFRNFDFWKWSFQRFPSVCIISWWRCHSNSNVSVSCVHPTRFNPRVSLWCRWLNFISQVGFCLMSFGGAAKFSGEFTLNAKFPCFCRAWSQQVNSQLIFIRAGEAFPRKSLLIAFWLSEIGACSF